jgi:hypothetical protein
LVNCHIWKVENLNAKWLWWRNIQGTILENVQIPKYGISNVEILQGPRPPLPRGSNLPQMVGEYIANWNI